MRAAKRRVGAILIAALVGGAVVALPALAPPAAEAATAPAPTTMWRETFENGTSNSYVGLEAYAGVDGERYTASPYWLDFSQCNGFLLSANSTIPALCPASGHSSLRSLTTALGNIQGAPNPANNFALASYSVYNQTSPYGYTMLETVDPVPVEFREAATRMRYIGFSVDAAETACGFPHQAQLVFELSYGGQTYTVSEPIKPCSDPRASSYGSARGGRFFSPGAFLVDAGAPGVPQPAGIVMSNLEPHGGSGNDAAVDNISVYDVTPVVEPSFVETAVPSNGVATYRLEVVNSTDLAGKPGWGFEATLPDGLELVPGTTPGGSCAASVDATGSTIAVTDGNLPANTASCDITVSVRPVSPPDRENPARQTYVAAASDLDETVGVDPVGSDTIEFYFVDLEVTKSSSPADPGPGDLVSYTVRATNVGNGPYLAAFPAILVDDLSDIIDDADFNGDASFDRAGDTVLTGTPRLSWSGGLAEGDTVTLTYSVTVTDPPSPGSDGILRNVAFAPGGVGEPTPDCAPADPDPAVACTVNELDVWGFTLTKSPSTTIAVLGETVTYTLTAANNGRSPLTVTAIDDPLLEDLAWTGGLTPPFELGPGDSATATGTYTLLQSDVDAGSVPNTATISAETMLGTSIQRSASANVTSPRSPGLSVVKIADLDGPVDPVPGTPIDFTAVITNTGNVTLTGVVLSDPLIPSADVAYEWPDPAAPGVLGPGQYAIATAAYPITQTDIEAGQVVNTATVDAVTTQGEPIHELSNEERVPIGQTAAIRIVKSAALADRWRDLGAVAGTIPYEFIITNTGNLVLENVTATDPLLGALTYGTWPGEPGRLAPGDQVTASGVYAITQADLDHGSVANTATATGVPTVPADAPTAQSNTVTVVLPANPSIGLAKSAAVAEPVSAGSTVDYEFTITNPGNLTLSGVEISDPLLADATIAYTWPDPAQPGVLPPGLEATATASLPLTQERIDAGSLVNEASVTGTPPRSLPAVTAAAGASATWTRSPAISVTGLASFDEGSRPDSGDPVRFTYTMSNDGNTTLTSIRVDVPLLCEGATIEYHDWPATVGSLLPGEQGAATVSCALTRDEIDSGLAAQSAVATGQPPVGDPITDTASPSVTLPRLPEVQVEKSGEVADNGGAGPVYPGQVVVWELTISNPGNVTLDPLVIDDPPVGFGELVVESWPDQPGMLPAGMEVHATTWSVVSDADVDLGYVENRGRAVGTAPDEREVDAAQTARVELPEGPAIALTVDGALAEGARGVVGDLVTFTYVATNTGNVTLGEVDIVDPMPGLSALAFDWPGTEAVLAVGQSVTATATYAVTATDVERGWVADPATASGVSPQGTLVTAVADATVQLPRPPMPTTGVDAMLPLGLALWLLAAGAAFAAMRRPVRRRSVPHASESTR